MAAVASSSCVSLWNAGCCFQSLFKTNNHSWQHKHVWKQRCELGHVPSPRMGHCNKAWAAHQPCRSQEWELRPTRSCIHSETSTCLFEERVSAQGWALAAPQGLQHVCGRGSVFRGHTRLRWSKQRLHIPFLILKQIWSLRKNGPLQIIWHPRKEGVVLNPPSLEQFWDQMMPQNNWIRSCQAAGSHPSLLSQLRWNLSACSYKLPLFLRCLI